MRELKNADLRYCPQLGKNVIMEGKLAEGGYVLDCLNKAECGFCVNGCRNRLLGFTGLRADEAETAVSFGGS